MKNVFIQVVLFAALFLNISAYAQLPELVRSSAQPKSDSEQFNARPAEGSINGETDDDSELSEYKIPNEKKLHAEEAVKEILDQAELDASVAGRLVLTTARVMIQQKELVLGSCWDYIDAIYKNAGYQQRDRKTIFKGYKKGPFAKSTLVQPGDWLYFINRAYHNIGHSAIFVAWTNEAKKEALLISYAGGNLKKPARYHVYNIGSVYNIMRPNAK